MHVKIIKIGAFGYVYIRMIPIPVIAALIFFSCALNIIEIDIVIFWYKNFKSDFYWFVFTSLMCIFLGIANGLIISIMLSLILILKVSSKPIWNIV